MRFGEILVYYFVSPEVIRIKADLNICLHQTIHYYAWYASACLFASKYKDDCEQKKKHLNWKDIYAQSMETHR